MGEKTAAAWKLFEERRYSEAESLYLECLNEGAQPDTYRSALMGLVYVECFLENFDGARKYAARLVQDAQNEEERHIALHQSGMVERMAGKYQEAMALFLREAELLRTVFPEEAMLAATNRYEQGYVTFKMGALDDAEGLLRQSLADAKKAEDPMCIGCACRALAEVMDVKGERELRDSFCEKAIRAFEAAGDSIAVEEVRALFAPPCHSGMLPGEETI